VRIARFFLLAAACSLFNACSRAPQVSRTTLLASGNALAYTAPCGCCGGQSGGLPRRATYLRELAEELRGKAEKPPGAKAATPSAARGRIEV
jgi:hypothetical protein